MVFIVFYILSIVFYSFLKDAEILKYSSPDLDSIRSAPPLEMLPACIVSSTRLMGRVTYLATDQGRMGVLVLSLAAYKERNVRSCRCSQAYSPRYVFHTLVLREGTRHSLHFVSRAYDKPEINEQSSVDPRVLMEPIQSVTE